MSPMLDDHLGAAPQGMRWCPHCSSYGPSLQEKAERCTHCAGTGLLVDEAAALSAERGANGSPAACAGSD
jgi:hypothetical protein